eukprot:1179725-Prorocentrum_minimum.AAC.5
MATMTHRQENFHGWHAQGSRGNEGGNWRATSSSDRSGKASGSSPAARTSATEWLGGPSFGDTPASFSPTAPIAAPNRAGCDTWPKDIDELTDNL